MVWRKLYQDVARWRRVMRNAAKLYPDGDEEKLAANPIRVSAAEYREWFATLPEDFANAIVEHDYLNGESIRMDGALRMAPR